MIIERQKHTVHKTIVSVSGFIGRYIRAAGAETFVLLPSKWKAMIPWIHYSRTLPSEYSNTNQSERKARVISTAKYLSRHFWTGRAIAKGKNVGKLFDKRDNFIITF